MGTRSVHAARLTVLVVVTGVMALLAAPALAQEDEAFITVDQAHPATGSTHYFVSVTSADGALVTDTEVVATPIDPDGTERDPVALDSSGDGVYQGSVPMNDPGEWTVRFTSSDPPGSTDYRQQVSAANTSIEPAPSTEAPAPTDDDSDSSALPLVLVLVSLVAAAAIAAALVIRNRSKAADDNDDPHRNLEA